MYIDKESGYKLYVYLKFFFFIGLIYYNDRIYRVYGNIILYI